MSKQQTNELAKLRREARLAKAQVRMGGHPGSFERMNAALAAISELERQS